MKKVSMLFILSIVVLSLILTGCSIELPTASSQTSGSVSETTAQPKPVQKKPVKILWRNSREMDETKGAEVKEFIEANSGVKFEMIRVVAYDEFDQRLSVSLASQEDIDAIMLRNLTTYTSLYGNGALMKLNDLLEEHGKNLLKLYSKNDAWRATTYKNGNIYAIPKTVAVFGELLTVRKDWMDTLGISSIETIDEFEAYLRALKEADFDGNGVKDTCTLVTTGGFGPLEDSLFYCFTESYPVISVKGVYLDENGNITPSALHPKYKDYLKKMSEWYKEGLIHPDIYTIKEAQVSDLVIANKVGALAAWYSSHIRPWETLTETVPQAEYVHIAPKTVNGNPYKLP